MHIYWNTYFYFVFNKYFFDYYSNWVIEKLSINITYPFFSRKNYWYPVHCNRYKILGWWKKCIFIKFLLYPFMDQILFFRHFSGHNLIKIGSFRLPTHRRNDHMKFFWWSLPNNKIEISVKGDTCVLLGVKRVKKNCCN